MARYQDRRYVVGHRLTGDAQPMRADIEDCQVDDAAAQMSAGFLGLRHRIDRVAAFSQIVGEGFEQRDLVIEKQNAGPVRHCRPLSMFVQPPTRFLRSHVISGMISPCGDNRTGQSKTSVSALRYQKLSQPFFSYA